MVNLSLFFRAANQSNNLKDASKCGSDSGQAQFKSWSLQLQKQVLSMNLGQFLLTVVQLMRPCLMTLFLIFRFFLTVRTQCLFSMMIFDVQEVYNILLISIRTPLKVFKSSITFLQGNDASFCFFQVYHSQMSNLQCYIFCYQIILSTLMQHWQQRQRQRLHHNMIQQARPTIKRYTGSRQRVTLSGSRAKNNGTPHLGRKNNNNMPFRQVLSIFKLNKYQELLEEYGFPAKIKDKQSVHYIDQMIKKVDDKDHDKFLSLMSALLSITTEQKAMIPNTKRTPIIKRSLNRHYPPTHNSTHLKKCDSQATKKNVPSFRIKSKTQLQRNSMADTNTPSSKITQKSTIRKRCKNARDDSFIVHQFKIRGTHTVKFTNKKGFLERLQSKLNEIKNPHSKEENTDIHLYYKEIKQMYLSYDTATLTSNISNIDIQEIIDCYAIEIEQRIVQAPSKPLLNPQIKRTKLKTNKIQQLLKESLVIQDSLQKHQYVEQQLKSSMDDAVSLGDSDDEYKTSYEQSQQFFDPQIQSIAYDLSCFNYQYQDGTLGSCTRKDIKHFIQLVMMAGKMEKEAPIISYVYVKRVLNICKRDKISSSNWKNLILVTLIEASKIWDDQSLQNHSFSKVIKPYTTLEINRLERHLLNFLNYDLKIDSKEYCQSYFNLRKHASEAAKTAHLMPLTLQTIKKLQAGPKKCQKSLKSSYKNKLNESF